MKYEIRNEPFSKALNYRTFILNLYSVLFGTENFGFCVIMKIFFSRIALATILKKSKIKAQNVKFAGKIKY